MSFNHKNNIELIDELIRLTQQNSIIWETKEPQEGMNGMDIKIDLVYQAYYLESNIRIYESRKKHYIDEFQYIWVTEIIMDMVDEDNRVLWNFPYAPNIQELFNVVRFKNPVVQKFYNNFLK